MHAFRSLSLRQSRLIRQSIMQLHCFVFASGKYPHVSTNGFVQKILYTCIDCNHVEEQLWHPAFARFIAVHGVCKHLAGSQSLTDKHVNKTAGCRNMSDLVLSQVVWHQWSSPISTPYEAPSELWWAQCHQSSSAAPLLTGELRTAANS